MTYSHVSEYHTVTRAQVSIVYHVGYQIVVKSERQQGAQTSSKQDRMWSPERRARREAAKRDATTFHSALGRR